MGGERIESGLRLPVAQVTPVPTPQTVSDEPSMQNSSPSIIGSTIAAGEQPSPFDFNANLRRFTLQQQFQPLSQQVSAQPQPHPTPPPSVVWTSNTSNGAGADLNGLRAGDAVAVRITSADTQADVLRRAYTAYAERAGLSSAATSRFVEQMMRGGERIQHAGTDRLFTDEEFAAKRDAGTINMSVTEGQVAELRRLKIEDLLSYGVLDWAVTESDERQIVELLRSDPNVSQTVRSLHNSDYLGALIDRVDNTEQRRELITLLGSRVDAETAQLVEPHIERLDVTPMPQGAGGSPVTQDQVSYNVWQVRFNLARLGVTAPTSDFNRAAYDDLLSGNPITPFSGVGATGVNPSTAAGDVPTTDVVKYGIHRDIYPAFPETYARYNNPGMSLGSTEERRRQVELFVRQPISTMMPELYGGQLPSREDVIRAAATRYNLEPELVAAVILAEQRDQSRLEDGKDYAAATRLGGDTSIGLGQIKISTARNHDLFADLMSERTQRNLTHNDRARLLASDEVNIFATARYIRHVANMGASPELRAREAARGVFERPPAQDLSRTQRALPNLNLASYARHSSDWSDDNIRMLGSEYTSHPWDNSLELYSERLHLEGLEEDKDVLGSYQWGDFVFDAYRDVKGGGVFRR